MDYKNNLLLAILLLLTPFLCHATNNEAKIPANFPSQLLYEGKPIDPLCFETSDESNSVASLKECGIKSSPSKKITGYNDGLLDKGYIGYDYAWTDNDTPDNSARNYSYYKWVGETNGSHIVYTLNNTGGSGQFSSIVLVKRNENTLQIKSLTGGDRCNGGISDVTLKDNLLTYSQNMTPYDFLELSKNNPQQLKAYNDLDACAACCAGSLIIERDLLKSIDKENPIAVDLSDDYQPASENDKKYQVCFDKLYTNYIKNGKKQLSFKELQEFIATFNKECTAK